MMEQSAFPYTEPQMSECPDIYAIHRGMTLRDYFAAKALTGLLVGLDNPIPYADGIADQAYLLADAMMKARDRS